MTKLSCSTQIKRQVLRHALRKSSDMFRAIVFLVICGTAVASDLAVRETARRSGVSVADVQTYLKRCEDSQFNMNLCAHYQFVKADLELNEEYKKLAVRNDERNTEALKRAQRIWVQLRDQGRAYESSDLEGGTLRPVVELGCMRRMTSERTEWVREMLSCSSVRGVCQSESRSKK